MSDQVQVKATNEHSTLVVAKIGAIIIAALVLSTPPERLKPYVNKSVIAIVVVGLFVAFVWDLALFLVLAMVAGILAVHIDIVQIKMSVNEQFAEKKCKHSVPTAKPPPEQTMPLSVIPEDQLPDTGTARGEAGGSKHYSNDADEIYSIYSDDMDDIKNGCHLGDMDDMESISSISLSDYSPSEINKIVPVEKFVNMSHGRKKPAHTSLSPSPYQEGKIPNHLALKMVVERDRDR